MNNINWKNKKTKTILGVITTFVIAPLVFYSNCGEVTDSTQTILNSDGTRQKVFIDIAGENVGGLNSNGAAQEVDEAHIEILKTGEPKSSDVIQSFAKTTTNAPLCAQWQQEAYLKPTNGDAHDQFGSNVQISGNRIVAGASLEDSSQTTITNGVGSSQDNSAVNAGAAYVFLRTNNFQWQQEAYLKAPNNDADDRFGYSTAISGDRIVVGAIYEASSQTIITNGSTASTNNGSTHAGAAYIFVRNNNVWQQEAYLKASNANSADNFGSSVSISGDRIVVGADSEKSNQTFITNGTGASSNNSWQNAGAGYVFVRINGSWEQEAYLKPSNLNIHDSFGETVSIQGNRILVSAFAEDSNQNFITNGPIASSNNSEDDSGAVYIFKRSNNLWEQEAYLKPSNVDGSDFLWDEDGDHFGHHAVSISGDRIVVGTHQEDSGQTFITNGSGAALDDSAPIAGAAYVFARINNEWIQEAYLKPSNLQSWDNFGWSTSIFGDTIVVGSPLEDSNQDFITNGPTASSNNNKEDSGAVYVFARVGGLWQQEAYLKPSNSDSFDEFGIAASIDGDRIVVGAFYEDSAQSHITNGPYASLNNSKENAGAAYVFWCNKTGVKPPKPIFPGVPVEPGPVPDPTNPGPLPTVK